MAQEYQNPYQNGIIENVDGFPFNRKLSESEKHKMKIIIEEAQKNAKDFLSNLKINEPGNRVGSFEPSGAVIALYLENLAQNLGALNTEEINVFAHVFIHECKMGYPKYEA